MAIENGAYSSVSNEATTLERLETKLDNVLARSERRWPSYMKCETAAEFVDVSPASIRRMISAGKLKAHRPCKGSVRVSREELAQLVSTSTATPRRGRGRR